VLDGAGRSWHRAELDAEVAALAAQLESCAARVLATTMDNSPAWIVADLAAERAAIVHVPLPLFFTPEQVAHALRSAGVDHVLVAAELAGRWPAASAQACTVAGERLALVRLPSAPAAMPAGTAKVTFTSGTTGTPKGVCLTAEAMRRVAGGLVETLAPLAIARHLCALPFAVLLENIAGVMAPMARGATCVALPLARLGITGSSTFDVARFHACVEEQRPHSMIVLPQMLRAWTGYLQHTGLRACDSLRFVAVGGAAVGARLIASARAVGVPAYEGYGLSEGASVQTLNVPGADRPGSCGRPLPHARVRVAGDGELHVAGSLFAGYLGDPSPPPAWWPTGDIGAIDAEGFVHVRGRRSNVLVTGYGRNVSPEWVETALREEPAVANATVFGDDQPALGAVLWPAQPNVSDAQLAAAVAAANSGLPDYARVQRWVRARAPFSAEAGLATANGRPRRDEILHLHADALGIAASRAH
jgi:long-subunit acyl-CoA synthetase (AMP-forming)